MKLRIKFGLNSVEKEVEWFKDLMDFPKLIRYDGKKWEWATYDGSKYAGYDLLFSQVATYDPTYYADMQSFEELFEWNSTKCCCGAAYTSFNWDHMRMCPKWIKW
jgi:hypothetical protein